MTNLPTSQDINPSPDDLNGQVAERHFLGKTLEEAEQQFHTPEVYCEDLMWMGMKAYRFYVYAAMNCVKSGEQVDYSYLLSSLAGLFEWRLAYYRDELTSIAADLAAFCRFVSEHYERISVASEYYGDLRPRFAALEQSFVELAESGNA